MENDRYFHMYLGTMFIKLILIIELHYGNTKSILRDAIIVLGGSETIIFIHRRYSRDVTSVKIRRHLIS